jgi:hypothetical protein
MSVFIRGLIQHLAMIGYQAISGDPNISHLRIFSQKLRGHGMILIIFKYFFPTPPRFIKWYHASGYSIRNGRGMGTPVNIPNKKSQEGHPSLLFFDGGDKSHSHGTPITKEYPGDMKKR